MLHTLLIAAIFVPYIVIMVILGTYIYRSGRHPRTDDPPDAGEDSRPHLLPACLSLWPAVPH